MPLPILPSKITVIIRDETPLYIQEPCKLRRVTIDLTSEQADSLQLRYLGKNCGNDQYEEFSSAFLEI